MSTTATATPTKIKIAGRLSYAKIWQPDVEKTEEGKEYKKYSTALLISKKDTASVNAIKEAVAYLEAGFKEKNKGKLPKNWKTPLRDGDEEREDDAVYSGMYFLNASTRQKPAVFKKEGGEVVEVKDESEVYSGCYVKVVLNLFTFDTKGNQGIGVGLNGIFKTRDGEKLAGGGASASDFADDETEEEDFI